MEIKEYNKPLLCSIFGVIFSLIMALISPLFGAVMPTALMSMAIPDFDESRKAVNFMCLCIFLIGIVTAIAGTLSKAFFAVTGENITLHVRMNLYASILRKNLGWHDLRQNSTGILTGVLSRDVGFLNAVSTEQQSV
jgi:ABC-type multidrug transport system fused ATPase/permease subunit